MLEFLKSKWWDKYCDWCYMLRNDWVDNLVSKEYKENSVEISIIYIYIGNYKYISYIFEFTSWDCYMDCLKWYFWLIYVFLSLNN